MNQVANSALTSALVMHVFAAIVSFFSAFFLIRYKLALAPKDVEQGASHAAGDQNARSSSHSPDADDGSKAACDIFVHTSHRRTCLIGSPRLVSSSRWQAWCASHGRDWR